METARSNPADLVDHARRLDADDYDTVLACDASRVAKTSAWALTARNGDLYFEVLPKVGGSTMIGELAGFLFALDIAAASSSGPVLIVTDALALVDTMRADDPNERLRKFSHWTRKARHAVTDSHLLDAVRHIDKLGDRLHVAHIKGHAATNLANPIEVLHWNADMYARQAARGNPVPGRWTDDGVVA